MDTHETHMTRALLATRFDDTDADELARLLMQDWQGEAGAPTTIDAALRGTAAYLATLIMACGFAAAAIARATPRA